MERMVQSDIVDTLVSIQESIQAEDILVKDFMNGKLEFEKFFEMISESYIMK